MQGLSDTDLLNRNRSIRSVDIRGLSGIYASMTERSKVVPHFRWYPAAHGTREDFDVTCARCHWPL